MSDKLNQFKQLSNTIIDKKVAQTRHQQQLDSISKLEKSLIVVMRQLVQFLDGKTTKTEVVNQLKSISTPDVDKVVKALEKLDKNLVDSKLDLSPLKAELTSLNDQLQALPAKMPTYTGQDEIKVSNLSEIDIKSLEKAITSLKLPQPKVNIDAPIIHVDKPDLEALKQPLLDILSQIKAVKYPETDLTRVEKKLDEANKHLKAITEKKMGGGGGGGNGTPYIDGTGKPLNVELVNGRIPVDVDMATEGIATDYTWVGGLLSQKVETFTDRTVTTDYTWTTGELTQKTVTIT